MDADLARCLTKLFWCNIQLTLKEYHKCARTEEQEKEITKSFYLKGASSVHILCQRLLFEKLCLLIALLKRHDLICFYYIEQTLR
ncbi:hypothetical protein WR25_01901 isoform B [Diploscapter pachys]|uniref:Uncharacterized protein n=1 Tax=Diploscapter pachys TaxID=2018661 RepID=A0A2A2KYM7_9BILA|nr:hypothetical protein WR25_01901 isoform B [Diploscapter pachys]